MGSALGHSNFESKINYNYKNYIKKIRYEGNTKIITILNNDGAIREFKTTKHTKLK